MIELAAACRCPNPAVLLGVRPVGRPRPRRLLGGQPAARCDGRPAARQGQDCVALRCGLWPDPAGHRHHRRATRSPASRRSGLRAMAPERAVEAGLCDSRRRPAGVRRRPRRGCGCSSSRNASRIRCPQGSRSRRTWPPTDDGRRIIARHSAAVLNLTADTALDLRRRCSISGVDSLLALDLRKRLKRATGGNRAAGAPFSAASPPPSSSRTWNDPSRKWNTCVTDIADIRSRSMSAGWS